MPGDCSCRKLTCMSTISLILGNNKYKLYIKVFYCKFYVYNGIRTFTIQMQCPASRGFGIHIQRQVTDIGYAFFLLGTLQDPFKCTRTLFFHPSASQARSQRGVREAYPPADTVSPSSAISISYTYS